ncbi:substrate-binding domain-containing protein [Nocardioides jishulii]|uniref:VWA domain-containing protein n=1 Tax=Nocardioides jishulii TaxID=2575440 RepID=A0A4U2YTL0_9ACTN|nr:VWA domain-containing protein [Nocardioides jishulii]QCX28279.1 VWA domain-containing protein [Nocardioides jishulii]TKI64828.1 VWA domain-containing protein [Nocardioides jishulii]
MSTGRHSEANRRGLTSVALVVALVAAVAGVGWLAFGPDGATSADDCDVDRPVVISVVPAMELAMEKALEDLKKGDACFPAEIRAESPAAVEDSFFNGGRPDLWVADTPARVDGLASIGVNTTTLTPSLAVSPIGLVGTKAGTQHPSWVEALESGAVMLGDPQVDSASAMALIAPVMEGGVAGERAQAVVTTVAQAYGGRAVEGNVEKPVLDEVGGSYSKLVPVTEQEMITKGEGNKTLVDLTPGTGAPALTFPLVKANGGAPDTDLVATALRDWFASQDGRIALADAGLRPSDGSPLVGRGLEQDKVLAEVPAVQFNQVLGQFGMLSVPSSMLVVFDASGSMDFPAAGGTRMDLAGNAALTALDVLPDTTRLGLWAFSIEQGGPGQDWRELAPMRRLQDTTKGMKHEAFLRKQVTTLKDLTQGGTGLYDTTLAAYKQAVKNYDRGYYNALVIFSDGANDDPGSISLTKLLAELDSLKDPDKPVRVVALGISDDADMAALEAIAKTTGGSWFQTNTPEDILTALSKSISAR